MQNKGKLYLIPSLLWPETEAQTLPIYNLEVIKNIKCFLAENERSARRFISALRLGIKIEALRFHSLDKDTKAEELAEVFKLLAAGTDVGVISEAGCPGVADPGALAVALAHHNDIEVLPLVGPSSILMALMASGFSGQSFVFHGYLPIEKNERQLAIKRLEKEAVSKHQTQIFIETPYRNTALFADIIACCSPHTQVCVACDITAPRHFIKTKNVSQWKKAIPDLHKKPTVFLIYAQ